MRILAVRGENLASLEAPFEVRFDAPPLEGAGVFAIVGPTGAGKTTLLDAICLALFDTTPRLENGRRVQVEDEGLVSTDPRSVLRRRAVTGFAEVDFFGVDRKTHRARWKVRRARGKATGALQAREWSIEAIGGARDPARTDKEVSRAIELRLGLTFDQFRRAVLLAQGEFAALLRAKEDDRAELLEQMTGTQIYARVSAEAFARARVERESLAAVKQSVDRVEVLEETARASLEASMAEARDAVVAARAEIDGLAEAVRWHEVQRALAIDVDAAQKALTEAMMAIDAEAPMRRAIAEFDALLPLAPAIAEQGRATIEASAAAAALETAIGDHATAIARAEASIAKVIEASRTAAGARAALDAMAPDLAAARARDVELATSDARLRAEIAARDVAAARVDGSVARCAIVDGEIDRCARAIAALDAASEARPEAASMVARWSSLEPQLARWRSAVEDQARLAAQADPAALDRANARLTLEIQRSVEAQRAHAEAAATRTSADATLAAIDLRAIVDERDRLKDAQAAIERASIDVSRVARLREEAAIATAAERASIEQERDAATATEAARAETIAIAARLDEAERALRGIEAQLDVQSRRGDLRDGDPCPLCGATEHPWAAHEAIASAIVDEQRSRVRALREALEAAREAARSGASRKEVATSDRARWAADAARLSHAADDADALLFEARSRSPLDLWLAGDAPMAVAIAAAVSEIESAIARVRASAEAHEQARLRAFDASAALDAATMAVAGTREIVESVRGERDAIAQAEAALAAKAHATATLIEAIEADLGVVLATMEDPRRDAAGVIARCGQLVAETIARAERRAEIESERRSFADERTRLEAAIAERRRALEGAESVVSAVEFAHRRLREARAQLLDGDDADAVEARLRGAIDVAVHAEEIARAENETAQRLASESKARVEERTQRAATATIARDEAVAKLAEACRDRGVTVDAATATLSNGREEIALGRARLAQLDEAIDRARTVFRERSRVRDEHASASVPALDEPATRARLESMGALRDAAETRRAEAEARVRADDLRREDRAKLGLEIVRAEARAKVWLDLNDLIGSADGSKLRRFAQGLSFQALVDAANAHLAEMAPRWHLARPDKTDLELAVIDRDMGDEPRATASLSGGESFIVSLALALGLASIGGTRARVETLFIDEGFGTLDEKSLEAVLACLDSLHAGGRQIGVISHVGELAARLGTRVEVRRVAAGKSVVRVVRQ